MKSCKVCHKFIKQPEYCPKHEPPSFDARQRFLNQLTQQATGDPQGLFASGMQQALGAQQFGGLGGSLEGLLGSPQGGFQSHPPTIPPSCSSSLVGSDLSGLVKWVAEKLSWLLNPVTQLAVRVGVLKEK